MNELDKKIQEALRKEDAELFDEFRQEPSVFALMVEVYRGRHRKLVWLTTFWVLVFFILAIVTAIQFFKAEETRMILIWGVAFMSCMSAVTMLKVWLWMEMNKNAITREIKRLELQIARLAARVKD